MDQVGDANPQNGHSDDYQKLVDLGIDEMIAAELNKIYQSGKLCHSDLDDRALDALKELSGDDGVTVLHEFNDIDLPHVPNKSAYLCSVMKVVRQRKARTNEAKDHKEPDEEKIKAMLDRTGYDFEVTAGQRKYGGPPPGMESTPPGQGHEVFCGKLPKDVYEDELVPLFEQCGKLWDLRIMMDPVNACSRGYCFVTYCDTEAAGAAVKTLDGHEIRPGKHIKVNASVANVRLFVGNIPKNKSKEDIQKEFDKIVQGLSDVIIYCNADDRKKNRGFAFLHFDTHKNASLARKRLSSGRHRAWNSDIIVDWADPQEEPDAQTMSKVKVLYVRNLSVDVTEDILKETFGAFGETERVKKLKDYAFVHFVEREHAMAAMEALHDTKIGKHEVDISLAKPMVDNKKKEMRRREQEKRHMYMMGRYSGYEDMWYPPMWRGPPHRGMRGSGRPFQPPPHRGHQYEPYIDDEMFGYEDEFGGGCLPPLPPPPVPPPPHMRGRGRGPPRMPFRGGSSARGMRGMVPPPMGPRGLPPPPGGIPPPARGPIGRGGPGRGRGMMHGDMLSGRGVPSRGSVASRRAMRSRTAPSRGAPARGAPSRGAPARGTTGRIATRVATARHNQRADVPANRGSKRKVVDASSALIDVKQRRVEPPKSAAEPKTWHIQPIAQQPLKSKTKQAAATEQWYEDSFGAGW